MADVARAARVSLGTASMALRDDPRISEGKRNLVRRRAVELGYVSPSQSHHQRALSRKVLNRVGVIFFGDGTIPPFIKPLMALCGQRDIRVEVQAGGVKAGEPALPSEDRLAEYDALILTDAVSISLLRTIQATGIPYVMVGRVLTQPGEAVEAELLQEVASDDYAAGRFATEWLIRQGHRRIAFYAGPILHGLFFYDWLSGYRVAMMDAGLTPGPIQTQDPPLSDLEIGRRLRGMLMAADRPTAFVVPGAILAERLRREALSVGVELDPRSVVIGDDRHRVEEKGFRQSPIADPDLAALARAALTRLHNQGLGWTETRGQWQIPYEYIRFDSPG